MGDAGVKRKRPTPAEQQSLRHRKPKLGADGSDPMDPASYSDAPRCVDLAKSMVYFALSMRPVCVSPALSVLFPCESCAAGVDGPRAWKDSLHREAKAFYWWKIRSADA